MAERKFVIRLADINIEIQPLFSYIQKYCRDYIVNEIPEITVRITQADISYEQEKAAEQDRIDGNAVRIYSPEYLETLAVYRKIVEALIPYGVLLIHGSCIAVDGEGYLFTAKSGTGKSTHTRLWREQFGDRAIMVNDDKPLIRIKESGILAYGTPWDGKHRINSNIAVPLKAMCILTRNPENRIVRLKQDFFVHIFQQVYRPSEGLLMENTMRSLDMLLRQVPVYKLECNMEQSAAEVSYNGMCGQFNEESK